MATFKRPRTAPCIAYTRKKRRHTIYCALGARVPKKDNKKTNRCLVVFTRRSDESGRYRMPCGTCRTCLPFFTMAIGDIEESNPALIERVKHASRTSAVNEVRLSPTETSPSATAAGSATTENRPGIRITPTPYDMYRRSALKYHGYDPEELDKDKPNRRLVIKDDKSEWHPATLRTIDGYLDCSNPRLLPTSIRKVVRIKMDQGSTAAKAYWQAIQRHERSIKSKSSHKT